ncbi:hypothetical protein HNR63_001122 [Anoxybacillus kamchatkensis]|nr:hypothetical protein [Anoxybacillus ayderensis]
MRHKQTPNQGHIFLCRFTLAEYKEITGEEFTA